MNKVERLFCPRLLQQRICRDINTEKRSRLGGRIFGPCEWTEPDLFRHHAVINPDYSWAQASRSRNTPYDTEENGRSETNTLNSHSGSSRQRRANQPGSSRCDWDRCETTATSGTNNWHTQVPASFLAGFGTTYTCVLGHRIVWRARGFAWQTTCLVLADGQRPRLCIQ